MARPTGIEARFEMAIQDALKEIAALAKKNILDAFSRGRGYTENGTPVTWDELNDDYVAKWRDGSKKPILEIEGVLKKSIDAIVTKTGIKTGVFSTTGRPNWAGGSTPVNEVSSHNYDRPHTNPSKKFQGESAFIINIFNKHTRRVMRQLESEGLL